MTLPRRSDHDGLGLPRPPVPKLEYTDVEVYKAMWQAEHDRANRLQAELDRLSQLSQELEGEYT